MDKEGVCVHVYAHIHTVHTQNFMKAFKGQEMHKKGVKKKTMIKHTHTSQHRSLLDVR